MTDRCFVLIQADGKEFDHGDGAPHFPTLEQANEAAARYLRIGDERGPYTPKQLTEPCVSIYCGECGEGLDEDGDGITYHFESQEEADKAAQDFDWKVTEDRKLCPGCAGQPVVPA